MYGQIKPLNPKEREQMSSMDIDSLSVCLFRWLKENLNTDRADYREFCSIKGLRRFLFPERENNIADQDQFKLSEAIANLERRRLVVRVFERNTDRPGLCLTDIGMKSDVDDTVLLIVDKPEEIVAALEQKVGRLDDVVRQYYLESLRAYQEELYISSVICLGAASERAIHWLTEAIEINFQSYQPEIQKRRNGSIAALTNYLSDSVVSDIPNYDKKFANELKERLSGLAKIYRENRNEAGHPKTVDQSWLKDDQEILLLHFRKYITTISNAIKKL